jgi:sulfur relay (sulfurtransferase) DsrC/TusE family protein
MINKKQLSIGRKIEAEHKGTIKFLKQYVKQHKTFPSNKKIFTSIAKDHLLESKNYYSRLRKAKL